MNDKEKESWIESFYADMEQLAGFTRPADYKERGMKFLDKNRKPMRCQSEGLTKRGYHE